MARIEIRCLECGLHEVRPFAFRGLPPPPPTAPCSRCAAASAAFVRIGEDERAAEERAEALQRTLLRSTLRHLAADVPPSWDRRVALPTPGGRALFARAFVAQAEGAEGFELFAPVGLRAVPGPFVLAAVHVLGRTLAGEVVLAESDLDLTLPPAPDAPATPYYRRYVPAGGPFADAVARARAEVDAATDVLARAAAAEAGPGPIDETALTPPAISPAPLPDDAPDEAEVAQSVQRLLRRFGLDVEALPARFRHGSAVVSVSVQAVRGRPVVQFRAEIARGVDRLATLPFVADFNRAEDMGRFRLDADLVVYELSLLGEDLDAGELLRAVVHAAEVADDRDDAIAELGAGALAGADADGLPGLGAAFDRVDDGGLLEDVEAGVGDAVGRVDAYLRQLGLVPTLDDEGGRWIPSGSTQVCVRARDGRRGAVVVFTAPLLHSVPEGAEVAAVLDDLHGTVPGGAFVHDLAAHGVWYRDALFANDMDLSEFARALLDAAQAADDHDDDLAARLGGRRTLDVLGDARARAEEQALEACLGDLQSPAPAVRRAAAAALAHHEGTRVVDALTAALADPDADVVAAALRTLACGAAGEAASHVISNLCGVAVSPGYPPHGRRQALAGLETLGGGEALQAVRTALRDADPTVAARAARAVGGLAARGVDVGGAADSLIRLLASPDPWVLREAAVALAKVAESAPQKVEAAEAVARLGAMLDEAPAQARPAVFEALARLGDPAADRVADRAGDPSPDIRAGVARVLARTASERHLDALVALAADPSEEVREDAVAGLARVPGRRAAEALVEVVGRDADVDVRRLALEELVARPDDARAAGVDTVLAAADDDDPLRRDDARWATAALGLDTGEGVGGATARTLRRALGGRLDAVLADLEPARRRSLFADEQGAAEVCSDLLAGLAGAPTYPAYAFALVRLVARLGDPAGVLRAVGAGASALAAAARAVRSPEIVEGSGQSS